MNRTISFETAIEIRHWFIIPTVSITLFDGSFYFDFRFLFFTLFVCVKKKRHKPVSLNKKMSNALDFIPIKIEDVDMYSANDYIKRKSERITFRLTKLKRDVLESISKKKGIGLSKLITIAIVEYIENETKKNEWYYEE